MKRFSKDDTIDSTVRMLVKSGEWEAKRGSRHVRLENTKTGTCLTVPGSPSDRRAALNWMSQIRRLGAPV